jgi:hypothetical protein
MATGAMILGNLAVQLSCSAGQAGGAGVSIQQVPCASDGVTTRPCQAGSRPAPSAGRQLRAVRQQALRRGDGMKRGGQLLGYSVLLLLEPQWLRGGSVVACESRARLPPPSSSVAELAGVWRRVRLVLPPQ